MVRARSQGSGPLLFLEGLPEERAEAGHTTIPQTPLSFSYRRKAVQMRTTRCVEELVEQAWEVWGR